MHKQQAIRKVSTELELEEDIGLHIKSWKVQETSMVVILVLFLLAIAGLFGEGPVSSNKINAGNQVLEYETFGRHWGELKLTFRINGNSKNESIRVTIPQAYLDYFKVETIFPEPENTVVQNDQAIFTFNSHDNLIIHFYLTPEKTGYFTSTLQADQARYNISHFIYP